MIRGSNHPSLFLAPEAFVNITATVVQLFRYE